ncbi:MAG TPA: GNAT family N-acetyltransferase [Candidatus Binatia bacterium]|jgi:ribosomal protein S18 acetylase RimI-like enzyme|nr:GNAT family N-acetyltransferase [Candidatus Binatia bacterium]
MSTRQASVDDSCANLSFTRVEQYYSRRFRDAMQIYLSEFHSSRLPITKVLSLLRTESYQLFAVQDAEQVLAMALIWVCARPAFVHLDYIAVKREWKGRGIGTAFYRWLIEHLGQLSSRARLLTLEVEDELLGFYRRNQTQILHDVPYLFPASRGPLPMHLMVYDRQARTTLSRTVVQDIIRALYRGIHNRGADDVLLRSFISRVPQRVSLL